MNQSTRFHRDKVLLRSGLFVLVVTFYAIVVGLLGRSFSDSDAARTARELEGDDKDNDNNDFDEDNSSCDDLSKADPVWFLVFYFVGVLYMFWGIAIACDDFFVPTLEVLSETLGLPNDVAGATLMAAGGSAPELFSNIFGTFVQESEVGIGTVVGSAVFNVLFVIAMCAIWSKEVLELTWWPLFRDSAYYSIGLLVLGLFVGVISPGEIELWEAIVLFLLYIGYVLVMTCNQRLYKVITGKELVDLSEETNKSPDLESAKPPTTRNLSTIDEECARGGEDEEPTSEGLVEDADSTTEKHADTASDNESMNERSDKSTNEESNENMWERIQPPTNASSLWGHVTYLVKLPIVVALVLTVPDVQRPALQKLCYLSFVISILWIGFFSYFMVEWAEIIGHTLGIPSVIMGLTLLAGGTSAPDLLSSVAVARKGRGDMALSSSIGSNVFDILVGLPLPWIVYTAWNQTTITIGSNYLWVYIFTLLGMLVFVVSATHCQGWRLTNTLAAFMMIFYFGFLTMVILLELPFDVC